MDEYLSNPNCDEWNNPYSRFNVTVEYEWIYLPTGKTGTCQIKVTSAIYAEKLIEYWNSFIISGERWHYTLIKS